VARAKYIQQMLKATGSGTNRTSSFASISSAEGSGFFFFFGTTSSVVITAPSPLIFSQRVGPKTPLLGQSLRPR
jgi:hypothetical protein